MENLKDLEFDPQIIDLEKNETFLLPSKYRDKNASVTTGQLAMLQMSLLRFV